MPTELPQPHEQALGFTERNRELLEHFAGDRVHIKPAPPGLETFASDLETGTMFVHDRFYAEHGHELSDAMTCAGVFHECGHLEERRTMLTDRGGPERFRRYLERVKSSKAYSLLDNSVADIRENREFIRRANPGFAVIEQELYHQLFPSTDFRKLPRHIQFCHALLREHRLPDEPCDVAPQVRAELDGLAAISDAHRTRLLDAMTHPDVSMTTRLQLQDYFIWPMVEKLLEQDMADRDQTPPSDGPDSPPGEQTGEPGDKPNPDQVFGDEYKAAEHRMPHAVPIEDIEKEFKAWQEKHSEDAPDRADAEHATRLRVTKDQLQQYRQIVESLQNIRNPETHESVIEELRKLIDRIIARRFKPAPMPQYPVDEGEILVDPAGLYAQVQGGNLQPKVWERTEIKETPGPRFGEVEITLVCDRSGSMGQGGKSLEQQKAAVMVMEALKLLHDRARDEEVNLTKPLAVRSEIYTFQSSSQDGVPLKRLDEELSESKRIGIAGTLASVSGTTTDFVPLETIQKGLTDETRHKITVGELKKLVIVLTDGESNDPGEVAIQLEHLRSAGVVVVGVGITASGTAALTTYAPDARIAPKAEDLTQVLADVLREHLDTV